MSRKVNYKCLTLQQKVKILKECEAGLTVTTLAKKYGLAKSTICSIKKKRNQIIGITNQTLRPTKKRTLKTANDPAMETVLYKWFLKQRQKNFHVSGEMIRQKARSVSTNSNFTASDGWLQRFKTRYGIRLLKMSGEKLSSQPELVNPFKENFRRIVQELNLNKHQIYNADETGLFWKLLPDKTYVAANEKTAKGLKVAKQRLSLLGCTNATGSHKLTPLVIGKSKNPRALKNFRNPVIYKNSKNAWMTSVIFKSWFFENFVPEVKNFLRQQELPLKAVLVLDNCTSHPPAEELKTHDGMIFTVYLPPNVTALIQPMDQNVLRLTKLYYRKSLLSYIVSQTDDLAKSLKDLTIKDAILHLTAAWEKLSSTVIAKCWRSFFEEEFSDEDDVPLSVVRDNLRNDEFQSVIDDTITLLHETAPVGFYLEHRFDDC